MADAVRVSGLKELRKALKDAEQIGDTRELRDGLKQAAEIVAKDARRRIPARSGRARDSVRATAGGNKTYVEGGKKTVPYYGWLDFGTREPRSGAPRSVGPWAGSGKGPKQGRFIYPALDAKRDEVVQAVGKAVDNALNKLELN